MKVYVRTSNVAHEGGWVTGVYATLFAATQGEADWTSGATTGPLVTDEVGAGPLWGRRSETDTLNYDQIEEWEVSG